MYEAATVSHASVSSVLVAYARAAHRLSKKGESGARSVFDIAPAMLSQMTPEELRAHML